MNPIVSVIIPVYNAAQFLSQCLDSVINQSLKNIEIICVDDGSIDNSVEIINKYQVKDSRVILFQQKNSGAGVARNLGLSHARGKYVYFMDSDDFVDTQLLKSAVSVAEKEMADIVIFCYHLYNSQTKRLTNRVIGAHYTRVLLRGNIFSPLSLGEYAFEITTPEPWNKLFLRNFILSNNLMFMNLKHSNDIYFTSSAIGLANRIAVIDGAFYNYRININTNTGSSRNKSPTDIYQAMLAIKNRLCNTKRWSVLESAFINLALEHIMYHLTLFIQQDPDAFNELRNILISKGFDILGISAHSKKDFHHKFAYWKYQQLISGDINKFLLGTTQIQYQMRKHISNIYTHLRGLWLTLKNRGFIFTTRVILQYLRDYI